MSGDRVDFLLFEFQEGAARTGVEAVSGSFGPADWNRWAERLGVFVPLPERADRPSTAYLRSGADVVLLHRSPALDARQRDSTRTLALIGSPSVLTFTRAALLRGAPAAPDRAEWTGVGYPAAWTKVSYTDDDLRRDLEPYRAPLVTLVAAIQDGPRARFQFQTDLDFGALLLRAAHACLSRYLPGDEPDWTFSTSPTAEQAIGVERPRFVFDIGEPARTGQGSTRRRVDLSRPPRNADDAGQLVDFWFRYGPHEPARTPSFGPTADPPARAHLSTARASAGVRSRVDWAPIDTPVSVAPERHAESVGHTAPDRPAASGEPAARTAPASGEPAARTAPASELREHRRAPLTWIENLLPYLTGPYARLAALWIGSGLFIVVLAVVGGPR